MSLDAAIRLTGILIGFAYFLQSLEHLKRPADGRFFFALRAGAALWLMSGFAPPAAAALLFILGILGLQKFDGPYNGGSDRMGLLILWTLLVGELASPVLLREAAFGYLALQLTLSYFLAGAVKLRDPEWRDGRALTRIFRDSIYPVSESLRGWAERPARMRALGGAMLAFELLFPLCLLHPATLKAGLAVAFVFHVGNALILGLNRFVWVWLAAYPAVVWFQTRVLGG